MNSGRMPSSQGNASSGCAIILSAGVFVGGGREKFLVTGGAWGFLRFFSFLISSENRNKSFCSSLRNP